MKTFALSLAAAAALLALAACGNTTGDRAISGGGIGAAVGAVGGLLVGAPLEGALIAGALTKEDQIDLGKPVWKK